MIKYFLAIIFTLSLFSCKKDDLKSPEQPADYTSFLATSTQTFTGKLDSKYFSWSFGWSQSQQLAGFENGYGICDSADPVRVVFFGLTAESDLQTRFLLYSPRYNATSDTALNRVFSLGKKKLGDFGNDFYLAIYKDGKFYQSNSMNAANDIEILKTAAFTDYLGKKLRVWFKLNTKLTTCSCNDNGSLLTNGLMLAEFFGTQKGN